MTKFVLKVAGKERFWCGGNRGYTDYSDEAIPYSSRAQADATLTNIAPLCGSTKFEIVERAA